MWGIVVMQAWFFKTSLVGVRNHLIPVLRQKWEVS